MTQEETNMVLATALGILAFAVLSLGIRWGYLQGVALFSA